MIAACGSPTPSSTPEVASAIDADGAFTLTFELPKSTWKAGEPISGGARLSVASGSRIIYGAAEGPLNFSYRELRGHRVMGPASDAVCAPHDISEAAPITSPLGKSGGWDDNEADGAFYRAFFTRPDVRLPTGDWVVTALATFLLGEDCSGGSHDLEASAVLHIVD